MGLRIYVAGPMSKGNAFVLCRKAVDVAERLMVRGHQPFVPHLSFFWTYLYEHDYERWMEYDFIWIKQCQVLLRIPGESPGADREVNFAVKHNIPVFFGLKSFMESEYWTMDDIVDANSMKACNFGGIEFEKPFND